MEKSFDRTRLNFRDFIYIGLAVASTVAILIVSLVLFPKSGGTDVEVYYRNRLVDTFPLDDDRTLTFCRDDVSSAEGFVCDYNRMTDFEGPIVQLVIKDRGIQISEETSSRNLCSSQGKITSANTPLICLPNSFQAVIVGSKVPEYDN